MADLDSALNEWVSDDIPPSRPYLSHFLLHSLLSYVLSSSAFRSYGRNTQQNRRIAFPLPLCRIVRHSDICSQALRPFRSCSKCTVLHFLFNLPQCSKVRKGYRSGAAISYIPRSIARLLQSPFLKSSDAPFLLFKVGASFYRENGWSIILVVSSAQHLRLVLSSSLLFGAISILLPQSRRPIDCKKT